MLRKIRKDFEVSVKLVSICGKYYKMFNFRYTTNFPKYFHLKIWKKKEKSLITFQILRWKCPYSKKKEWKTYKSECLNWFNFEFVILCFRLERILVFNRIIELAIFNLRLLKKTDIFCIYRLSIFQEISINRMICTSPLIR